MSLHCNGLRNTSVLLTLMVLAGCQNGPGNKTTPRLEPEAEALLLEAIQAQREFYESGAEELRIEYDAMVERYPLMRQYVTLQEVAFALYALAVADAEHEIDCMEHRMLTTPGNTIWFSFCRDDLFEPDFDCIRACLDCLKTAQAMSCFQHCGCLKRIGESEE